MLSLARAIVATPLGDLQAIASEFGLCALEFTTPARRDRLGDRLRRWFPPFELVDDRSPIIDAARRWLDEYFAGTSAVVNGLPLDMRGAPFELKVWEALVEIPPGETTSYGAIAKRLESPGASRAVGAANGANPIPIIVPCHRVIGANGSLTGYGGGLPRKTWLLNHEARWRTNRLF